MPKKSRRKPRGTHFCSRKHLRKVLSNKDSSKSTQDNCTVHEISELEKSGSKREEHQDKTIEEQSPIEEQTEEELVSDLTTSKEVQLNSSYEELTVKEQQECELSSYVEPMDVDSFSIKNPSVKFAPIEDTADVTTNVGTVSDVIVIDHINGKSNTGKPWFTLKSRFVEDAFEPRSPTCVLVEPGWSGSSSRKGHEPFQDEMQDKNQPGSYLDASVTFDNSVSREHKPSLPALLYSNKGGSSVDDDTNLLINVRESLLLLLPLRWTPIVLRDGVHVCLLADSTPTLIQRALFFGLDGIVLASVNGKDLPAQHQFWHFLEKTRLNADSTKDFAEFVCRTVSRFRLYEICKGVEEFENVWKTAENAEIDHNRFRESRFTVACRSSECFMLVPSLKTKRCDKCTALWLLLSKRSKARESVLQRGPADRTPDKRKPSKYLTSPEIRERLVQKNTEIKRLRAANARLKSKIEGTINNEGVSIDSKTAQDFTEILTHEQHKHNGIIQEF